MLKATQSTKQYIISHNSDFHLDLNIIAQRLKDTPDLTLPLNEVLAFLVQLNEFDLGKFCYTIRG